jgi:hypothetical protein
VLGYGSLINHGLPENVSLVSNYKDQTMEFYAYGNIKAGDEYPDILVRRVFPEVDFSTYFGTPPF